MDMNRSERRRKEREVKKTVDTELIKFRKLFSKFDNNDFNIIENVIENRVANVLEESSYILDMIYSAKLTDLGFSWEQVEKFNNEVSKTFEEDGIKIQKLKMKLGKEYEKEMAKISAAVEKRIKELIESKTNKKETIEILLEENPLLTKSMLTNAYSRVSAGLKQEQVKEESEEDPEVNEAAKEIINIIEERKDMRKDDFQEKTEKGFKDEEVVVSGATVEQANLNPSVIAENATTQGKGLKVLSMTLKGENGTYRACENGVELTEMGSIICFENIGQVNEWANEVKKVFGMLKA